MSLRLQLNDGRSYQIRWDFEGRYKHVDGKADEKHRETRFRTLPGKVKKVKKNDAITSYSYSKPITVKEYVEAEKPMVECLLIDENGNIEESVSVEIKPRLANKPVRIMDRVKTIGADGKKIADTTVNYSVDKSTARYKPFSKEYARKKALSALLVKMACAWGPSILSANKNEQVGLIGNTATEVKQGRRRIWTLYLIHIGAYHKNPVNAKKLLKESAMILSEYQKIHREKVKRTSVIPIKKAAIALPAGGPTRELIPMAQIAGVEV